MMSGRENTWYNLLQRKGLGDDRGGDRTHDLRIKSPLLYQLSYPAEYPIILSGKQFRHQRRIQLPLHTESVPIERLGEIDWYSSNRRSKRRQKNGRLPKEPPAYCRVLVRLLR